MTLQAITNGIEQYLALKAKRPELSVDIAQSKTAKEVGEHIASAWIGYGLQQEEGDGPDQYKLTIEADPNTFDAAMRYLWLKPKTEGGITTYAMGGLPFIIDVIKDGKRHELTVRKAE